MLTLNKLDAIDADRLHRKLGRAWRAASDEDLDEGLARRRYRLLSRVYLHLHKALMRSHQTIVSRPNTLMT
jgi:hypothetical protein